MIATKTNQNMIHQLWNVSPQFWWVMFLVTSCIAKIPQSSVSMKVSPHQCCQDAMKVLWSHSFGVIFFLPEKPSQFFMIPKMNHFYKSFNLGFLTDWLKLFSSQLTHLHALCFSELLHRYIHAQRQVATHSQLWSHIIATLVNNCKLLVFLPVKLNIPCGLLVIV